MKWFRLVRSCHIKQDGDILSSEKSLYAKNYRWNPEKLGTTYLADSVETCVAECGRHWILKSAFMLNSHRRITGGLPAAWAEEYDKIREIDCWLAEVEVRRPELLLDFREPSKLEAAFVAMGFDEMKISLMLNDAVLAIPRLSDDSIPTQEFGRRIADAGHSGIMVPSARREKSACCVVYRKNEAGIMSLVAKHPLTLFGLEATGRRIGNNFSILNEEEIEFEFGGQKGRVRPVILSSRLMPTVLSNPSK